MRERRDWWMNSGDGAHGRKTGETGDGTREREDATWAKAWSGETGATLEKAAVIRSLLVGKRPVNTGDGVRGAGEVVRARGETLGVKAFWAAATSRIEGGGVEPGARMYGSAEPNLNRVPGGSILSRGPLSASYSVYKGWLYSKRSDTWHRSQRRV